MAKFKFFLFVLIFLNFVNAEAVEIWRNENPFTIKINLPNGATFEEDGIDRKFEIRGVSGNLRLIQDTYNSCAPLIAERQRNKLDDGFSSVLSSRSGTSDCSIKLRNPETGEIVSSNYIWMHECQCFAALQLSSTAETEQNRQGMIQNLLDQLRANNPPPADWSKKNQPYEILTCAQKRERGLKLEENEYDLCGNSGEKIAKKSPAEPSLRDKLKKEVAAAKLQKELEKIRRASAEKARIRRDRQNQELREQLAAIQAQTAALAQAARQRNTFHYSVQSQDRYTVSFAFYSKSRRWSWPGNNREYTIDSSRVYTDTLSCKPGEKICFGAWRRSDRTIQWDVGYGGNNGCDGCCFACGEQDFKRYIPASNRRSNSINEEALSSFLNGLSNGIQTYRNLNPPGGNNSSCGGSCSGISGTD